MSLGVPTSLKFTVPLILLGFAATLSTVNLIYHVPEAERSAEDRCRERVVQEMSRLQSTLEYLALKGDLAAAQHEIAVLAHNHDIVLAALADERKEIVAATRRDWLGKPAADVLPEYHAEQATGAMRERRARVVRSRNGDELLGYAGILMGPQEELRPSQSGALFLAYDLVRSKAEARAQVLHQSLYWAGWVIALAMASWWVFHYLLTRRTARLVRAAEQLAAGDLSTRSGLTGNDELGRLGRAFDSMALAIARDMTELKSYDDALRVSEASYRAIFDASEDSIFVHNIHTGAIVDVNPKACAIFGYSRDEFRQLDIGDLGSGEPPYTQQEAMVLIARAAAGERFHIEWHGKSKAGELRWHDVWGKRVTIGGQDRILALARDITDKKHAAEELTRQREALYQREKLAALGTLLAGVAHELNNPLSVVVARAVLLEEQGDPATQVVAGKIRTAAERCSRIVRTFLGMARQQPPERGPVAIDEVVAAALDMTAYPMRTSGIEVTLEPSSDMPHVLADADQIHQVLLNLMINAQQALQERPAPRRIHLSTRYDAGADRVRITVADNGPGIPQHFRARVFEPYFTTKPTGIGTGVGLAVSLGIVEAHGGELTLECPDEGGAAFTVALPVVCVEVSAARPRPQAARASATRRSILVVDDESEIREALASTLSGPKQRVVAVGSGHEALERLAALDFDLILTDVRMPGLDGRALYQEIARRWPHLASRVVFVTGDTLSAALNEFISKSGQPVIHKPFFPGDVRRLVEQRMEAMDWSPPVSTTG